MGENCKICGNEMDKAFYARVINKYSTSFYQCPQCKYLCPDNILWLDEAYKNPITVSDTGLLLRNIYLSKLSSCLIFCLFSKSCRHLDYGGGYGIFTRLMRDIGFDSFWFDPYTPNLFAQGYEYLHDSKIDIITSFESFEHFVNPIDDIEKILSISKNVIFSTQLLPSPTPKPGEWWYYGLEHGQHISFYSHETLKFIAKKFNLNLYSYNNIHIFTNNKINIVFFIFLIKLHWCIYPMISLILKSKTIDDMEKVKQMRGFI